MNDTTSPAADDAETTVVPLKTPSDGDLSTELLIALESEFDRPADELPPLSRAIDPAILDALGSAPTDDPPFLGRLTFEYAGRRVVVERVSDSGHGTPDIVATVLPVDEPAPQA